jgi:phage tail sheath protein FI
MSEYKHGSFSKESATSVLVVTDSGANISFVVGTAPINTTDETNVNELKRLANYEDAVKAFGFDHDYAKYSLSEAIDIFFTKYQIAPVYFVNVLDPTKHKKAATPETNPQINGQVILSQKDAIKSSVVVSVGKDTKKLDIDYSLAFNEDNQLIVTIIDESSIKPSDELTIAYDVFDITKVKVVDIIGGIDVAGNYSGIQLAQKVYPQFNEVLGSLIAPGWSQDITVSNALLATAKNLNTAFIANAIVDLDTSKIKTYQDAVNIKQKAGLTSEFLNVCFGDLYLADQKYNHSTMLCALKQYVAANNDSVPNKSPSNKAYFINGFKLNGTDLFLDRAQAQYLNGNGIIVARNGSSGWRCWGNRTACFPFDKDIKNFDIAVRDFGNFLRNTCVLTTDQMVDDTIERALILRIEATLQGWLDSLIGAGKLISGSISFPKEKNPLSELLAGNIYFRLQYTTGPTASSITIETSFNVHDLDKIFGEETV